MPFVMVLMAYCTCQFWMKRRNKYRLELAIFNFTNQEKLMRFKLIIVGLFAAVLLTSCSNAASSDETAPDSAQQTLSVSGSGIASTEPDVVDIQLGVDMTDPDLSSAVDQNNAKMNDVIAVFLKLGIDKKDIQTTNFNLWVEEVYDYNGQPTGDKRYHVSNMVNIRLRDLSQIGSLIEEATMAGATNASGINFSVADTTQLQKDALDNAIDNAQEKASAMASKMGVFLGPMISMTEGGYYGQPITVAAEGIGGGAAGIVPISQGQFSMTAQVQVVFEVQH